MPVVTTPTTTARPYGVLDGRAERQKKAVKQPAALRLSNVCEVVRRQHDRLLRLRVLQTEADPEA